MEIIQLEKFDKESYDTFISWVDSAETLMQIAGPTLSFPLTKEQLDHSLADKNRFAYKVLDAGSNEMIGHGEIYVKEDSAKLGKIFIGEPKYRGKGLGQQLVQKLLKIVFIDLKQTKAELNVFDWNTRAIRCYEKAGFVVNPSLKFERTVNGKSWTAINMVLEKEHWQQL